MRGLIVAFLLASMVRVTGAAPVDTHQFGLLTRGMSAEVLVERLGRPDAVLTHPTETRGTVRRGTVQARTAERETWIYRGGSQSLDTVLTLEDGVLVSKDKRR